MNKKGFTLVELLTTITILVLMGLIIGVNITSILKSTEEDNDKFTKEQIEKAACVFVDSEVNTSGLCQDHGSTCGDIKVTDLTASGLLGSDIIDLINDGTISNSDSIKVCYKDNEKICEFNCTEASCKCN